MRHQNRVAKLGRTASHRKAMLMNLATALIQHGKIKTTDAKAKELRRVVERLITYGKRGTVHHRRLAYKVLHNRTLVKTLFEHIAPQYTDRNGGYTRIIKLGFRDNDSAEVSLIELVDYRQPGEKKSGKSTKPAKTTKAEKKTAPAKQKPAVEETKRAEAAVVDDVPAETASEESTAEEPEQAEEAEEQPAK
jgi:large subunit ribosomal protein L17